MKWRQLDSGTYAVIFETGDEAVSGLTQFAKSQRLAASQFTAIGAFESLTLGYFEWEKKQYKKNPVNEQVEVLSFLGDITLEKEEAKLHVHCVVGRADGTALGGHLMDGKVRPTLEVIIREAPAHLKRTWNEEAQLALIDVDKR